MIMIKPVNGLKIFDPVHRNFMPDEGIQINALNSYWIRRIKEGGVVVLKESSKTTTKKATKSKSKE
jgi:hypothetical protein